MDWAGYAGQPLRLVRRNLKLEESDVDAYFHHNPELRFVCLLRNPVERCISHYGHIVRKGWKKGVRFPHRRTGLTRVVYDVNAAVAEALGDRELPEFIAKSLYHSGLRPYLDRFGVDRLLVMTLEEASARPSEALARVAALFGLDPFPPVDARSRVNVESYSRRGLFARRIDVVPPTPETLAALEELLRPELRRLDEALGVELSRAWTRQLPERLVQFQ